MDSGYRWVLWDENSNLDSDLSLWEQNAGPFKMEMLNAFNLLPGGIILSIILSYHFLSISLCCRLFGYSEVSVARLVTKISVKFYQYLW